MLDFIKNRNSQQQSAAPPAQPETAKQMYTREAVQEKTAAKPLDRIPAEQQQKVEGIKADLQRATQHMGRDVPSASPTPTDATANPQPMAQMSMNQEKTAAPLSPTTAQAGVRARARESSRTAAPRQEKPQDRAQTMARRPPSWER